jgi:hypothetical protein
LGEKETGRHPGTRAGDREEPRGPGPGDKEKRNGAAEGAKKTTGKSPGEASEKDGAEEKDESEATTEEGEGRRRARAEAGPAAVSCCGVYELRVGCWVAFGVWRCCVAGAYRDTCSACKKECFTFGPGRRM